ncbi:MAG: 4-hydroxy-tetrahydrodipicolinate reductase [Bacillota bacterium]
MEQRVKVIAAGVAGRMGQTVCRALLRSAGAELVGAVDPAWAGRELGEALPGAPPGLRVAAEAEEALARWPAEVWVDFTLAAAARAAIPQAIARGVAPVVGTTGLDPAEVNTWEEECRRRGLGAAFIPNFSVGAMLLERFARWAAALMEGAEIIELHHAGKRDAPSGTALRLTKAISAAQNEDRRYPIPIHSVRLPGLLAHHEVLFGREGETLLLRHDVRDRSAFIPPLLLTIRRVARERLVARSLEEVFT